MRRPRWEKKALKQTNKCLFILQALPPRPQHFSTRECTRAPVPIRATCWTYYMGSNVKTRTGNVETVKYVNNTPDSPKEKVYVRDGQDLHGRDTFTRDSM